MPKQAQLLASLLFHPFEVDMIPKKPVLYMACSTLHSNRFTSWLHALQDSVVESLCYTLCLNRNRTPAMFCHNLTKTISIAIIFRADKLHFVHK